MFFEHLCYDTLCQLLHTEVNTGDKVPALKGLQAMGRCWKGNMLQNSIEAVIMK